jgi:hypothetical protein
VLVEGPVVILPATPVNAVLTDIVPRPQKGRIHMTRRPERFLQASYVVFDHFNSVKGCACQKSERYSPSLVLV